MEDLFDKYKDVFRGLYLNNGVYNVIIQIPKGWGIVESEDTNIKIEQSPTVGERMYTICADMKLVQLSKIFSYIEYIISFNKNIINKKKLFKEKYKELLDLFTQYPLEELETITFKINKPKGRKKIAKPVDDEDKSKKDAPTSDRLNTKLESNITSTDSKEEICILKESDIDNLGF